MREFVTMMKVVHQSNNRMSQIVREYSFAAVPDTGKAVAGAITQLFRREQQNVVL